MNMPLVSMNRRRRIGGAAAFTPAGLFALSEPGVWYDPSDVANLAWRRNLLTYSEDLTNAAWVKFNSSVSGQTITATSTSGPVVRQIGLANAAGTYVFKSRVQRLVSDWCVVFISNAGSDYVAAWVNLATGSLGSVNSVGSGWSGSATIQTVSAGVYDLTLVVTKPSSANSHAAVMLSNGDGSFTGVLNSTLGLVRAQLELGSVATDYQKITDVNTEVIERFPSATLYQDTAGTTPVTTPGQTVALALDKSKGLVLGPELVTNGDFSVDADWTKPTNGTISGGTANFAPGGGATANFTQTKTGLSNTWVRYSITVSNRTAGQVQFRVLGSGGISGGTTALANGTYTGLLQVLGNLASFQLLGTDTSNLSVDNVTVRELPGFHATQATLASRPTYGIVPLGGRRNLLTRTEEFDNADWVKTNATITADFGAAPNGTSTADRLVTVGTGNTLKTVYQVFSAAATTYTFSAYVKDNGGAARAIDLFFATTTLSATVGTTYNFDTDTLTNLSSAAPFTFVSSSRTSVGSGWFRVSVAVTVASAQTIRLYITAPYAAAQVGNYLIWGAQLETGSSTTNYQRVTTGFDVTEAGVASLSYLSFDGVDDSLVTPSVNFSTDKMTVFAGVRKLSDAVLGLVVEGNSSGNGVFYILGSGNSGIYQFFSKGTINAFADGLTAFPAPSTNVLTGLGDIAGDIATIRVDGVVRETVTTDQGTGNYSLQPINIGRRSGGSLPFNGQLYSLIVRNAATDAATITSSETWVAGKTGVTL